MGCPSSPAQDSTTGLSQPTANGITHEAYEVVSQGAQAAHLGYRSDQPVFSEKRRESTGQHGQEDRGSFKEI